MKLFLFAALLVSTLVATASVSFAYDIVPSPHLCPRGSRPAPEYTTDRFGNRRFIGYYCAAGNGGGGGGSP